MYFLLLFYKVGLGKDTYTWLVRRESVLVVSHVLIYVFKFQFAINSLKLPFRSQSIKFLNYIFKELAYIYYDKCF